MTIVVATFLGCAARREILFEPLANEPGKKSAPYLKLVKIPQEKIELQIAARRFVPEKGKGPEIWIVAVSHIGESNYYYNLQSHLDRMTIVLYEGVGMSSSGKKQSNRKIYDSEKARTLNKNKSTDSSIQSRLARTLGLVFQLEAIDYSRPNFKNCDMTFAQLQTVFEERKTEEMSISPEAVKEWEKVKDLYSGDSFTVQLMELALKVLGNSPKMRALMRIVLIETLGKIDDDLTQWGGLPAGVKELFQVLVRERNKVIIEGLKRELPGVKRNGKIALFYGAAHSIDLENQLMRELKYRPLDQKWFTAFSVDLQQHKISEFELRFVSNIVDTVIREMRGKY